MNLRIFLGQKHVKNISIGATEHKIHHIRAILLFLKKKQGGKDLWAGTAQLGRGRSNWAGAGAGAETGHAEQTGWVEEAGRCWAARRDRARLALGRWSGPSGGWLDADPGAARSVYGRGSARAAAVVDLGSATYGRERREREKRARGDWLGEHWRRGAVRVGGARVGAG
jgi:hypothetical protein